MSIFKRLLELVPGKKDAVDKLLNVKGSIDPNSNKPLPDTLEPLEDEDDEIENIVKYGGLPELYDAATRLAGTRKGMYSLYDEMEQDTLVASSLEMITDDATQYSFEQNATIWPEAGRYQEDIKDFFDTIDVENKIWGWTYNTGKYGDFFLQPVGEPDRGIVRVIDDHHPGIVFRLEVQGALASFMLAPDQTRDIYKKDVLLTEPYHIVHFMNNYKPTFDTYTIEFDKKDEAGKTVRVSRTITASYGTSVLYNVRQAFRNLKLMEKSLALARLARSPQIRIFYVNTEGMTPKERQNYMKEVKEKFKRKQVMDKDSDFFDSKYNPLSYNDDLFIPITSSQGDIRSETLGGEVDVKSMVDVDYFLNKFFSGIRIPKVFMGFEEAMPGTMGNQTLTTLDIRYARMVKKVQRAIIQGMLRLVQIHLAYKYKKRPILSEIVLGMTSISSVEESQRFEVLERRFAIVTTLFQMVRELEDKVDQKIMIDYAFKNIVKLNGLDLQAFLNPRNRTKEAGGSSSKKGFSFDSIPPEIANLGESDKERFFNCLITIVEWLKRENVSSSELRQFVSYAERGIKPGVMYSDQYDKNLEAALP